MKNRLHYLHAASVLLILAFCLFQGFKAIQHFGNEYLALTIARSSMSLLCGSYAIAQLVLVGSKIFSTQAMLLFYPLSYFLGTYTIDFVQGYFKNWAPATEIEAHNENVFYITIILGLILMCIVSCYVAFSQHTRNAK